MSATFGFDCSGNSALTYTNKTGSKLPLLAARSTVTFPTTQNYFPLAGTKLYCLLTGAHA